MYVDDYSADLLLRWCCNDHFIKKMETPAYNTQFTISTFQQDERMQISWL